MNENASVRRTEVAAEDMKLITSQDFTEIQRIARGYCRAVDSTRAVASSGVVWLVGL